MIRMPASIHKHPPRDSVESRDFQQVHFVIDDAIDDQTASVGRDVPKLPSLPETLLELGLIDCPTPIPLQKIPRKLTTFALEFDIAAEIEREFVGSSYPIRNIRCQLVDAKLILIGRLFQYFHVQIAIQTAMRLADGYQVVNRIEVSPFVDDSVSDAHPDRDVGENLTSVEQ